MNGRLLLPVGAVVLSILVVPAALTALLVGFGPPTGSGPRLTLLGSIAMLPGVVMGAAALWVAGVQNDRSH